MSDNTIRSLDADRAASYAALSPFLNGTAPQAAEQRATTEREAANAAAAAVRSPETPYLNPAISIIAAQAAVSPANSVLYGDAGFLVQAYDAVALISGPQSIPPIYGSPATPAIPPPAPVK